MEGQLASKEYSQYRWVILILTVACFMLTFLTRLTWPPMISVVVPELKMNMSQAGAYMSAFYIGYVITQVPGGVLADRFGVSLILAGSLIISGLTTFGMGFITDFDTGFWLRIATGLGGGAVISCCARALMEWFPAKERGTAFGLLFMAPSVGVVLSNYVVPALNAILQWRGTFQAIGIATTLLGILIYFLVKTSDQAKGEKKALLGGFKVIFSSRDLILVCLAGFCLMWVQIGTMTWANAFIKRLGFSLQDAGYVMIWYGIGGVIAPAVSGYISDKMGNRKALLLGSYIVTIPLTVIFGYMTTMPMLMLLAFIFGFCSFVANPHLNLLVSEYAGKEWAATANGTAGFVYQLAPIIGSVILGWSIDITGNFNIVWWLMAVGPLVGTLLLLPIRVPKSI